MSNSFHGINVLRNIKQACFYLFCSISFSFWSSEDILHPLVLTMLKLSCILDWLKRK